MEATIDNAIKNSRRLILLELCLLILEGKADTYKDLHLFNSGLCAMIEKMRGYKIITEEDENLLFDTLRENIPDEYYRRHNKFKLLDVDPTAVYYFEPSHREPRIDYLKDLIEKYKGE